MSIEYKTEKVSRYNLETRNSEGLVDLSNIASYHVVELVNILIDAGYTHVTLTLNKDDGD